MSGDDKDGVSINIGLGKETDAALGDALRQLLLKPTKEAGDLISDSIGLFGDKIKRKRMLNARLGLEGVRKTLEANNVDMKNITPPAEEELHLLLEGMSLSGEERVREMWSGLFAKALEPGSGIKAERQFIAVLQSLSPMDAKIIDFLAFLDKTDRDLRHFGNQSKASIPKDLVNMSSEVKDKLQEIQNANLKHREAAILAIENKAEEYGLKALSDFYWADNLMRLGVIERPSAPIMSRAAPRVRSIGDSGGSELYNYVNQQISSLEKSQKRSSSLPATLFASGSSRDQIKLEVAMTPFGKRLAKACGVL